MSVQRLRLKSRFLPGALLTCAAVGLAACAAAPRLAPCDADAQRQAADVLARLTLEEKLSLVRGNSTMTINAIPEKGIPSEFVMSDGPHTVRQDLRREDFGALRKPDDLSDASTVFPALSALAATWDPALARRFGEAMGEEARARGKDMLLGPGVNIARTPLCGRNYEYMGEDPVLAARMAVPVIQGIQSRDVAACVKHFAVNSQELNRSGVDAHLDERTLREIYLPAFEAAVKEGGALTVMNAFNKVNGVFCSHNADLNRAILKGEWGFPGFVVTDWGSLHDPVGGALGGTDLEMNAGHSIRHYKQPLADAVRSGKVPEARIDDMAGRVLYVQAALHKLDGKPRAAGRRNTPEHQALAREIAAEGMVLLKNAESTLPLKACTIKRLLVVGQGAVTKHGSSGWSAEGKPPYEITPLEGLKATLPGTEIVFAPFPALNTSLSVLPDALLLLENPAKNADTGMRNMGWALERFANDRLEGIPVERGFVRAPALTGSVRNIRFSMRWQTRFRAPESGDYAFGVTCDDGARVFLDGKVLIDAWGDGAARFASGTVYLEAGREYALRVDYRQAGGDAAFTFGWRLPSEAGANYAELAAEARKADAVLLFTGTRHGHGSALECEGGDRPDLNLLPLDDAGIAALAGINPRTAVIVHAGSPVRMPWLANVPAVLLMSYSGQEAGNALADVLLGRREPAGRLPFTWPRRLKDVPVHALDDYAKDVVHHKEGLFVGYRGFDANGVEPLYPFGYGLGYSRFEIGRPKAEVSGETVAVTVPVTNVGARSGTTVVQLYVEPPQQSPVPRAPRQLKAFAKLRLNPGETQTANFTLFPRDFAYWDVNLPGWRHEQGTFTLAVGRSSRDLPGRVSVTLPEHCCNEE